MTTTGDKYRAGQAADFDRHDVAEDSPLRALVADVYDKADLLDQDQQGIFLLNTLAATSDALDHAVEATHGPVRSQLLLAQSFVSVAGYMLEQAREVYGLTSTDDVRVEAVYQAIKSMVRESTMTGMPEDTRSKVDTVAAAVRQRLAVGEGPAEKIIAEEVERVGGIDGVDFSVEGHDSGPGAQSTETRDEPSTGMYL